MSRYWVQHTPSTAYTEYSIHWVQHPPRIVCLPFILIITIWPLNVASASGVPCYMIDRHQPALHDSSKVKSHSHGCELTNWWVSAPGALSIDCLQVLVQTRSITAYKFARSRPPSASPSSHDYGLQMHLQTRTITASKLARSRPPSVSPNSHNYALQRASPNSLDHDLGVHL